MLHDVTVTCGKAATLWTGRHAATTTTAIVGVVDVCGGGVDVNVQGYNAIKLHIK